MTSWVKLDPRAAQWARPLCPDSDRTTDIPEQPLRAITGCTNSRRYRLIRIRVLPSRALQKELLARSYSLVLQSHWRR